jgi:hypothetical protein
MPEPTPPTTVAGYPNNPSEQIVSDLLHALKRHFAAPAQEQRETAVAPLLPDCLGRIKESSERPHPHFVAWSVETIVTAGEVANTAGETLPAASNVRGFQPNQVEALLFQCQELLERIHRERAEYADYRARDLELSLDAFRSACDYELMKARHSGIAVPFANGDIKTYELPKHAAASEYYAIHNWLRVPPAADPNATPDAINKYLRDAENYQVKERDGKQSSAQFSLLVDRLRHSLEHASKLELEKATYYRWLQASRDVDDFAANVETMREISERKVNALRGGAWNFSERCQSMEDQMRQDWRDVQLRAWTAYEGLRTYFGYGSNGEPPLPEGPNADVGALATWIRQAISFHVAFTHHEAAQTEVISLRSQLRDSWGPFLKALMESSAAEADFDIPVDRLRKLGFCRMAGLSATVEGNRSLSLTVSLPMAAIAGNGTRIAQKLPGVHLGRVEPRTAVRPPEMAGTATIRNASPIGDPDSLDGRWRVHAQLHPAFGAGPPGQVDDIHLELCVAAIPEVK